MISPLLNEIPEVVPFPPSHILWHSTTALETEPRYKALAPEWSLIHKANGYWKALGENHLEEAAQISSTCAQVAMEIVLVRLT